MLIFCHDIARYYAIVMPYRTSAAAADAADALLFFFFLFSPLVMLSMPLPFIA